PPGRGGQGRQVRGVLPAPGRSAPGAAPGVRRRGPPAGPPWPRDLVVSRGAATLPSALSLSSPTRSLVGAVWIERRACWPGRMAVANPLSRLSWRHPSMRSSPVVLAQVHVAFDDQRMVANAGLLLPATLADRLGIEQAAEELIDLGQRSGAARLGRK